MKIWITYFYNIRFLKPHQVPLSTAVWDPKWYSCGETGKAWMNKDSVIYGLRLEELNPKNCHAIECCPCPNKGNTDGNCDFLRSYSEGLSKLNFSEIYKKLESIQEMVSKYTGKEAEIVLIVYETPRNPCSERKPIMDWFQKNGINIQELNI